MKNNEKPDILSKIKGIKLRRELTVLLAFFVMLSTSYVMIHPGEALNNSTARSFMFFNEEDGVTEETAVPDMNALLDADRDSGAAETAETEEPVQEEVQNEETAAVVTEEAASVPASTPAETVVPTLEPTVTPENTAEATETPEALESANPEETAEAVNTSDPFSTASTEPVLEETSTPEATASASPEDSASPEATASAEPVLEETSTPEATASASPDPSATPEATASAEPTATPEAEEEEYPAFSEENIVPLEEDGTETEENIRVFIKAAEGTFPEGTTVKVVLVRDTKVLEAIEQAAVEKAKEEDIDVKVNQVQAVDITFTDKDGNEIQPKDGSKVAISFKSALIEEAEDTTVVHVEQDENKENVTNTNVMDKVEKAEDEDLVEKIDSDEAVVMADSFSIYGFAISETIEKEITIHSADGTDKIYVVSVTYGPDANIPDGSTVEVRPFEEGTEEYERARNAVLADKKEKDEFVDIDDFNLAALDISIIDPNGQEIEPEATVTVDIKIKDLPGVENLDEIKETLEIQHHVEVTNGVVVEKVFDGSVEGSYEMDTDKNIAKAGTVVDPSSVSDEDFRNVEVDGGNDLDASFDTEVFSTFTITWRNNNAYRATVHYVDESGTELTISNPNNTHPNIDNNDSSPAFLIYDIDGYEYSYTYRNTNTTGNRIMPILERNHNSNNRWYYTTGTGTNPSWSELGNNDNIYVVYKKKAEPTTGGTPVIDDATSSDWPQDPETPQFSKSSVHNGNGTNTVSLSINGGEKDYEKATPADVIVIMDVSGSMRWNMAHTTQYDAGQAQNMNHNSRMWLAADAVNDMADALLNGSNNDVRMALISFSTEASVVQSFTNNYSTYSSKVNALTPEGGTNWEQALQLANRMEVRPDAATYIVFVTDGDPTFRMTRGDLTNNNLDMYTGTTYTYYRNNHVFGDGQDGNDHQTTVTRCFNAAVPEVSSINNSNKSFYAIGISNSVTKVQNLTTQGGVAADHAFVASDEEAMENAFKQITESIKAVLGFGDVEITDGITELSNVEMKMMHEVDPDSFTYYKVTSSGQTSWDPASEGAGLASYDEETGAVKWELGEGFQLEDGVTYMVTFRVWPSQEAYDLIADLNNGVKVYASGQPNSITAEEREQIQELAAPTATSQGSYTLKTNTDTVKATYSQTSSTGETVTVSGETDLTATYHPGTIENMDLESMKLTVKKVFEDDLTSGEDRDTEVKLILKRRDAHQTTTGEFVPYAVPQTSGMSSEIVLNEGNNWTYSFYVAPGFEVDGEVLEHGYDFTITEPDIDYHYGLIEEIINPMVVDGEDKYYGDGELINGETIEEYTDQSLTAVNRVKSGIDIQKHVYDVDGTTEIYPETEFTITGQLLGPDGQPYTWQDGDDVDASGAYHKYDKDGNRIVYKGHFADSSNITFTLKAGERIRFINVPDGCTFQFTESTTGMDALGYQWMSTDAVTQHRTGPGEDFVTDGDVQPVVSGQTATLSTGVVGNKQYAITYGNKRTIPLPDVELVKVDATYTDQKLNDAEFTLYSDEELTTPVTVDGNGNAISIKTGNKEGSDGPDGWYNIGLLSAGTYYLVETSEPTGYVLDETPVIITVTKETSSYTVTATKDGTSVISGPTEGVYTITVSNERATKYVKVFKYETGSNPEKALQGAQFTLTGPEGTDISYTNLTTNTDGYLVFGDNTYVELPVNNAAYTLTETKAPDGYNMMTENVVFTVTTGGVTGTGTGYTVVPGTETIDDAEVSVYIIKVQNSAGVELPHTGGLGTLPYTLGGITVMLTALMYGFRMRRRERRLN